MTQHYLKPLFEPKSVAVFGASEREGAVGTLVFKNMLEGGFKGKVYPLNPNHPTIQGQSAYRSLSELNRPVDLAVIATPASTVPGIISDCGEHGVRAAVILSAGFREVGAEGRKLEQALVETARRYGIRFIGPNCLGIMRPAIGLNATFNKGGAQAGRLALVSQSGALCTAILDWAAPNAIGFSTVVSTGISADLDFGEVLDYLVSDPQTESILLYIEGIHNARSFMSGLRAAARVKPVIAAKVGRHAAGSKAAMSHTGALVGADDVFDAALRRAGVVRGMRIGQLFSAASSLAAHYKVEGQRLAIVTNGGGPGVMASDRAADLELPLAALSEATMTQLGKVLPPTWSKSNPVDVIGDATAERYAAAVDVCLTDRGVDGVLVILTPQAMTDPTGVAEAIIQVARKTKKPLFTCWMGGAQVSEGRSRFVTAGLPTFNTPEAAVEGFSYLTSYYQNQRLLLQTPAPMSERRPPDVEGARLIIESALAEGRAVLSETESKALLSAFHIDTTHSVVVRSPNEALVQAEAMGFPVALKINSPDITHKSDAGGVVLGINNAQAVRTAYNDLIKTVQRNRPQARIDGVTIQPMVRRPNGRELLVGIFSDPVFGPVITFGAGGTTVEVMGDRAVELPPLNRFLAADMIGRTRISKMLGAFRHMAPADLDALEGVLLRVSEIACELPWVRELDINPLIVDENGAVALDARVVVGYHSTAQERYAHMAIYPYPSHLVTAFQLPDGTNITVRPIRPEDAEIEQKFVRNLSERAKYFRFMQTLEELSPPMLARFTQIDYDREMALIAVVDQPGGEEVEVGVCRYVINPDGKSCEFAIVVADQWQRRGIAHRLMGQLMESARHRDLEIMEGDILASNHEMIALAKTLGFTLTPSAEDPSVRRVQKRL